MPAFTDTRTAQLQSVIATLYGRAIAHKLSNLAHHEAKTLLVREEHFQAVEDARELFGTDAGAGAEVKMIEPGRKDPVLVHFEMVVSPDHPGFPFPNYVGQDLYGDPEGEARKKLDSWVRWRTRVGREWCLANAVFVELNRRCTTPAQVRYFWPCVVGLLKLINDDKAQVQAEKLAPYKAPSDLPRVDKAFADACRVATAIVSKGLLYPDPKENPPPAEKEVRLALSSFVAPPRPWEPDKRCSLIQPA